MRLFATAAIAATALLTQASANGPNFQHTCTTTQDMLKKDIDLVGITEKGELWTDPDFTLENALYWSDEDGVYHARDVYDQVYAQGQWVRASEIFPSSSLWGSGGVKPSDVKHGASVKNEFFAAAAAALANIPGRIEEMFVNTEGEQTKAGIYGVNFFALGQKITVTIDDYLPVVKRSDGSYDTVFGQLDENDALWFVLFEKAYAKFLGNYEHLRRNWAARYVIENMDGSFSNEISANDDADKTWAKINECLLKKRPVVSFGAYSSYEGLQNHKSYVVLDTVTLSTGDRLVRVYDPAGIDLYTGEWSDQSDKWTDALRQEVGTFKKDSDGEWISEDDGLFYVDIQGFAEHCGRLTWNTAPDEFVISTFNMIDDDTDVKGQVHPDRTYHKVTIDSDEKQDLHWRLMGSWYGLSFSEECQEKQKSVDWYQKSNRERHFTADETWSFMWPIDSVHQWFTTVEYDYSDELPKDWALFIRTPSSPVQIKHVEGGTNGKKLPLIEKAKKANPAERTAFESWVNSQDTSAPMSTSSCEPQFAEEVVGDRLNLIVFLPDGCTAYNGNILARMPRAAYDQVYSQHLGANKWSCMEVQGGDASTTGDVLCDLPVSTTHNKYAWQLAKNDQAGETSLELLSFINTV